MDFNSRFIDQLREKALKYHQVQESIRGFRVYKNRESLKPSGIYSRELQVIKNFG